MGREFSRSLEGVAILVVEASLTGSKDNSGDEGGGSSSQVDHTGSGEIDNTHTAEGIVTESGQETVGTPDGVDDHGVDETGEEDGVA